MSVCSHVPRPKRPRAGAPPAPGAAMSADAAELPTRRCRLEGLLVGDGTDAGHVQGCPGQIEKEGIRALHTFPSELGEASVCLQHPLGWPGLCLRDWNCHSRPTGMAGVAATAPGELSPGAPPPDTSPARCWPWLSLTLPAPSRAPGGD